MVDLSSQLSQLIQGWYRRIKNQIGDPYLQTTIIFTTNSYNSCSQCPTVALEAIFRKIISMLIGFPLCKTMVVVINAVLPLHQLEIAEMNGFGLTNQVF